jgi:hypothetical protein
MPQVETFFRPLFKGPLDTQVGGVTPWAGRTVIGSGVVTVTVSTARIGSDSLIFLGSQISSGGVISSAGAVVVNSVVPGVSFAFTRDSGVAAPWATTVMWMLVAPRG